MNSENMNKQNLSNLRALWKIMGAEKVYSKADMNIFQSANWPHRTWIEVQYDSPSVEIAEYLSPHLKNAQVIQIPQMQNADVRYLEKHLVEKGFSLQFTQTAMYLDVVTPGPSHSSASTPNESTSLETRTIYKYSDIPTWTSIASEAFGYDIDEAVIERIHQCPQVSLCMAYVDQHAVATALLFKTGDFTGLHQFGVRPDFRGQGIAQMFMESIISDAYRSSIPNIVLQASEKGRPLYEKLGFKRQFKINNYVRR